jgi:hypothetical protein
MDRAFAQDLERLKSAADRKLSSVILRSAKNVVEAGNFGTRRAGKVWDTLKNKQPTKPSTGSKMGKNANDNTKKRKRESASNDGPNKRHQTPEAERIPLSFSAIRADSEWQPVVG